MTVDEVGNSTILMRALEGDVNFDCRVDIIDDQSESGRYGSFFGSLWYRPLYDLEPSIADDDIDIKDLQFVFGRNWHHLCTASDAGSDADAAPAKKRPHVDANGDAGLHHTNAYRVHRNADTDPFDAASQAHAYRLSHSRVARARP